MIYYSKKKIWIRVIQHADHMVILHVKPCGRAGRLPSVTRAHIIDWVRSPSFISWFLKLSCEGAYHLVKRSIRAVTVTYLDKLWKVRISVLCIYEVICIRTCTGINKRMIEYTTGCRFNDFQSLKQPLICFILQTQSLLFIPVNL